MGIALEFVGVFVFTALLIGLVWSPVILVARRRPEGVRQLFRIWTTFGIVGVALAAIAFLAVVVAPH